MTGQLVPRIGDWVRDTDGNLGKVTGLFWPGLVWPKGGAVSIVWESGARTFFYPPYRGMALVSVVEMLAWLDLVE